MDRNLPILANTKYDVVIVGGGIFGICAAWDAVLRGFSVALVEKSDFSAGTSANSYKIVHGGIRYVQHADVGRIRSSCRERSCLLRVAPHLVQPLPTVIPTYGHGKNGKGALAAGMFIYDLLTSDRNRLIKDPDRRIPKARFLSHNELIELFPGVERKNLTGAAVFCDGQMYNPTRLAVSFLRAAVDGGAEAANYLEAIGFLWTKHSICGIKVRDRLTDEEFEIHGKVVLNATGPWAERFNFNELRLERKRTGIYSRDACFVVRRRFAHGYALAVQGRTRDPDAILSRSARHLFVVPWRDYSLIGVWHVVHDGHPEEFTVTERELQSFIDEINGAYLGLDLTLDDILLWNAGLVPFGDNEPGSTDLSYGKQSILIDHAREHNIHGLVTLIGIRYTMARGDSARAIDLIAAKLGHRAPNPPTDRTPIHGGRIECFEELVREARQEKKFDFSDKVIRALLHNYGAEYGRVLKFASRNPSLVEVIGDSTVIKAEVIHAVREEMALKLADVVLRRTDLGTGEYPGIDTLQTCAQLMAAELGWTVERVRDEIAAVMRAFPLHADGPDPAISGVAS